LIATGLALSFLCETPQYQKESKKEPDWFPLVVEPLHYLLGYLFLYIVL
jgi:hypothetical protein